MSDIITKTLRSGFLIIAFSLTIKGVSAQTCGTPPTCDSLGYQQSSSDCDGAKRVLKCPFDTSKLFCVELPVVCNIGDILYSDKSCSKTVTSGKTAIGVVFDTSKRLAVALEQASSRLIWGGYGTDIPTLANCTSSSTVSSCGTDGKSNTSAIIAYGKSNGISYPAAKYCASYNTSGTETGDWFLPSMADLQSIYNARTYVNASLQLLGKPALNTDYYYWSSTEYDSIGSWGAGMVYGSGDGNHKGYDGDVRAVVAF